MELLGICSYSIYVTVPRKRRNKRLYMWYGIVFSGRYPPSGQLTEKQKGRAILLEDVGPPVNTDT